MNTSAVLFTPDTMRDEVVGDKNAPVMRGVPLPTTPKEIKSILSSSGVAVKTFASLVDPSRRTVAFYDPKHDLKSATGWTLPIFHDGILSGRVLVCGLTSSGDLTSIVGESGSDWYGTIMGCEQMQWSRAGGIQHLPLPALEHWIMTIPRLASLYPALD